MLSNYQTIFWDFDGVILDSMPVRDKGFRYIFRDYPNEEVVKLIEYHRVQGGLSRYVKIRYFYEEILGKTITEKKVMDYAEEFSSLMKKELTNKTNLIQDSLKYIANNYKHQKMVIVSGSDQKELRFLCKELHIDGYFLTIHGSPKPKKEWVKELIEEYNIDKNTTCLIGDSINDFEAAEYGGIDFFGYNNSVLKGKGGGYIQSFNTIKG